MVVVTVVINAPFLSLSNPIEPKKVNNYNHKPTKTVDLTSMIIIHGVEKIIKFIPRVTSYSCKSSYSML